MITLSLRGINGQARLDRQTVQTPIVGREMMTRTSDNGRTADAAAAAEALGPEVGALLRGLDPVGFLGALGQAAAGLARNPTGVLQASLDYLGGVVAATTATAARAFGADVAGPVEPAEKDRRFGDRTWRDNPGYYLLLQHYLLLARLTDDLVSAARLDGRTALKAEFVVRQLVDALAPTNTFLNPAVLKRLLETGGASAVRGARNLVEDVVGNGGLPRLVDREAFVVGKDLAATPGRVVLRNDLMELIQYAPRTESVYEVPLLCSPPWINKYYVMDLAPNRSFVEWAVTHGHTVFAISYRNPDETMREVTLDDYLVHGPRAALDAIEAITGTTSTNIVGLCLGGSLTAMLLAYLEQVGEHRVRSATLLNTLLDFAEPGVLGAFTDEATVAHLERQMARRGYLQAGQMASTFTLLRANDLLWSSFVNNWLLGDDPPPFDILAWNDDTTRMPAAMHSFYLRSCYQRNDFAHGRLALAGQVLRPDSITSDVYILSAIEDHIAPWHAGYASTRLLENATPRFVLSSSGHIAGIVNPPGPKSRYWTNEELPRDPERWLEGATQHQGSWWEDWAAWIGERSGGRREPPTLGGDGYEPLGEAPGTYIHES
jgi:polyhydroxyalkanoate synthase subunit PhaC